MQPNFGGGKTVVLEGYDGALYTLSKTTWDLKISHPERSHLQHNYEKLVETLKSPDDVRGSQQHEDCFIAYKKYERYWVIPGVELSRFAESLRAFLLFF
jgi:hypothetical protein